MGLDARKSHFAANKQQVADQPAHPRSLISAIVFRILECITASIFNIVANLCSWVDWFESYRVRNPEDGFSRDISYKAGTP